MAGKRSTPEQIIAKLRQVEVLTAQGKAVAEAVRAIGVDLPHLSGEPSGKVKRTRRVRWEIPAVEI